MNTAAFSADTILVQNADAGFVAAQYPVFQVVGAVIGKFFE